MLAAMMQSLGIQPEDVEQLKRLARTVNELPDRITRLEAAIARIESEVGTGEEKEPVLKDDVFLTRGE